MYTVQAFDPYDDLGQQWEEFKNKSAAEVYGRANYGEGNFIVEESRVMRDEISRKAA